MPPPRLTRTDLEPHLPVDLADGAQVRVDHLDCTAGHDGKRRLAIKRDGRDLLLYCHHCRGRGRVADACRPSLSRLSGPVASVRWDPSVCTRWVYNRSQWPQEALRWLVSTDLTDQELAPLAWDPVTERVVLPVWGAEGVLLAYQGRKVYPGSGPKYLTIAPPGVRPFMHLPGEAGGTVGVVEDFLSALKVRRVCGALCLMGTRMPVAALPELSRYSRAVVMLDNDNPDVRRAQTAVQQALALIIPDVVVEHLDDDPKNLPTAQLAQILKSPG